MSFVSFAANFGGTPPTPFRPFRAGERVFYLVGVDAGEGQPPSPSGQLEISARTEKGEGGNPVDRVSETARGWRGRARVTVATRSYSFARYTRGAKAEARSAAYWTDTAGRPLRIWSYVVACDDAAALGYRVPRGAINARRGNRGEGHENNARGTVFNGRVAPVVEREEIRREPVQAEPVAPVQAEPVAAGLQAAGLNVNRQERIARIVRRNRGESTPEQPRTDLGAARFAALDLSDGPAPDPAPETGEDLGAARFAMLDLD